MEVNKSTWSELISEGATTFLSRLELLAKKSEIEAAACQLQSEIVAMCASQKAALDSLIGLKTKTENSKSHYEGINQIAHYWYCVIAGLRLFELGADEVVITGGAEDCKSQGDVIGKINGRIKIVGEVYCVSSALWPAKTRKEVKKLKGKKRCQKFILYNREAKPKYISKTMKIAFYGVDRKSEDITLICHAGADGKQALPKINLETAQP